MKTLRHTAVARRLPALVRSVLILLIVIPLWPGVASATLLSAPGVVARQAPAWVYVFDDSAQALVFEGKGWGHGVGLCQWGARGRALGGQSAEQIVAAYFQGTSIQPAMAIDVTIRVLLDTERRLSPGKTTRITGQAGRWQVETGGTPAIEGVPGGYLQLSNEDNELRYAVKAPDGPTLGEGSLRSGLVLRPLEDATRFTIAYKPASQVPGRPGTYYDTYRGELSLTSGSDGLETINRLPLQDYLKGVVPAEMPASWPVEAVKAQTLTARTYAAWQVKTRAQQRYDVNDTGQYQVYLGANVERGNVNQLVDATAGQVIVHHGQAIQAFFFSTCAGWTENNESIWPGAPLSYLRGIHDVDPAGQPYDAAAPRFNWTTGALTAAQLEEIMNGDPATAIGRLLSLDLSQRTPSGRLLRVIAVGTQATRTFSPDALMTCFNRQHPSGVTQLWSTNFDLKWTTPEAVGQTQGLIPASPPGRSTPTPAEPAATPSPTRPTPAPAAAPTPVYHLEFTQPAPAQPDGPTNRYVPETGHNLGGAFLRFYDGWGGLELFGYPRTEELLEDGRTVQYLQRARLEFHADQVGTPYDVQLTLLGDLLSDGRRPFPTVEPFPSSDQQLYFAETGHSLSFGFLDYWRSRGGLDAFGYPISEELQEPNDDGSGRSYTVQYFQRARFEYHPELPEPYRISLGLLGDQFLARRLWLP